MKIISVRSRHAVCALVSALALGTSLTPAQLHAADKMELLSGAIKARQKGNLTEARKILEELNTSAPGDQRVISLLNQVNSELALKTKVADTKLPGTAVADSNPAKASEKTEKKAEAKKAEKKKEVTRDEIADIVSGKGSPENKVKMADADLAMARSQANDGKFDEANTTLANAIDKIKDEPLAEAQLKKMQDLRKQVYLDKVDAAIRRKDIKAADESLKEYASLASKDNKFETRQKEIYALSTNPYNYDPATINPAGVEQKRKVDELLTKGRALYIAGDNDAAYKMFQDVEAIDGNNPESKFFQMKIAEQRKELNRINYQKTREIFLQTVNQNWALPTIYDRTVTSGKDLKETTTQRKLNQIKIDEVNFRGLPLSRVIETLSALSVKNDNTKITPRPGVNLVLLDPSGADPTVNITLRDLTLQRVLEFVCEQVGYDFDPSEDAVTITPTTGEKSIRLRTEFFPVTQAMLIRMGVVKPSAATGTGAATTASPFDAPAPAAGGTDGGGGGGDSKEEALKKFFERAGVGFGTVSGSSLALTEAQLIVTQTQRNMERISRILRQFSESRQVTISSRFLEVQQGDLEEVGFDFLLRGNNAVFATNNRSINDAFAPRINSGRGITLARSTSVTDPITGVTSTVPADPFVVETSAPSLPGSVNIGSGSGQVGPGAIQPRGATAATGSAMALNETGLAGYQGTLGSYELEAIIKALSQKQGNDLMSAPTVTTMSDRQAKITVSQELLYPTEYGDIQIEVSNSVAVNGATGSGGASVAIAPGTPTGFEKRDVGIEMTVTPKIQEDGSIFLDIEPRVTEFEGFIEYGTPSVVVTPGTTVTVPPGFFQPIFTVRHVKTEVTIWDGATVLLGGLSREQVLTVEDKVPVLGDIPFIGRLFSSKGQSSTKKNLLIFVTANMIGPGGSPARQGLPGVPPGSIYSDSVVVTPAGPIQRTSVSEVTK